MQSSRRETRWTSTPKTKRIVLGGPSTLEGKSRSSQNALTHGCRSTIVILPGESQKDFDDLYDRWMAFYEPEEEAEAELVEQLILNKWFLQRNQRRYSEIEQELSNFNFASWTGEQHKKFQLALRYKTAAERSVGRAMSDVEIFIKKRKQAGKDLHRETDRTFRREVGLLQFSCRQEARIASKIAQAKLLKLDVSESEAALTQSERATHAAIERLKSKLGAAVPPGSPEDFSEPKPG